MTMARPRVLTLIALLALAPVPRALAGTGTSAAAAGAPSPADAAPAPALHSLQQQLAADPEPARPGRYAIPALFGTEVSPGTERFPQLMARLTHSQSEIATKQQNLLQYARTTGGSDRTRTFLQE